MKSNNEFKRSIFDKRDKYAARRKFFRSRMRVLVPAVACCIALCITLSTMMGVPPLSDITMSYPLSHPENIVSNWTNPAEDIELEIAEINLFSLQAGREDPLAGQRGVVNLMQMEPAAQSESYDDPFTISGEFYQHAAEFSIALFRQSVSQGENTLVSPLSVLLALSMTANGARGNTLSQMEQVLAGGIPINRLNQYLHALAGSLPSFSGSQLHIANSIWFDNGRINVLDEFLRTNGRYYGASAYQLPFNMQAVGLINQWVESNTHGMIDEIIDEIDESVVMYLINAIAFDASWARPFFSHNTRTHTFHALGGQRRNVDMMFRELLHIGGSDENLLPRFIEDDQATGFIKPYYGGNYSFAAILPNENVDIHDYIQSLSGERFMNLMNNRQLVTMEFGLPKFSFEYDLEMSQVLSNLGMTNAFTDTHADFNGIGTSPLGNIYINRVLHKTFIEVDEEGTRAAAVTAVEMAAQSVPPPPGQTVILDRPFVFAIIDNTTNLPIFIGSVMDIGD